MITFRPAIRENTPLIIGIAGPTKSGKTYSALRVATGLAKGGVIAMINAEGLRGHQYADKFKYVTCDLAPPFRPDSYTDALQAASTLNPAVVIIDSVSHMHDGPGGILEWHEEILDRMAGTDRGKRDKCTFTAWVEPKAAENQFIYALLSMKCPVILCLRAKEKIKIVTGKPPIDLGWQPIVGERVAFETIFTLMLTPHCKGAPDLSLSDMREPFDVLVPKGKPLDEALGKVLADWSTGSVIPASQAPAQKPAESAPPEPLPQPANIIHHSGVLIAHQPKDVTKRWPHRLTFTIEDGTELQVSTYEMPAEFKDTAAMIGRPVLFSYEEKPNPRGGAPFRNLTALELNRANEQGELAMPEEEVLPPPPTSGEPPELTEAKAALRKAGSINECNAIYKNCPLTLKQDLYPEYMAQTKKLEARKP